MRKNTMSTAAVILALLAAGATVQAQDTVSPERKIGEASKVVPVLQGDVVSLGVTLRFVDLQGQFESSTGARWEDFFDAGLGGVLDLSFLYEVDPGLHVGPYFALGADFFAGNLVTNGVNTYDVDPLLNIRAMAGVAVRTSFGPVFLEGRVGLGANYYPSSSFDVIGGPSGVEYVEGSAAFALETRATFGVMVSERSSFNLSIGYEMNGSPSASDESPGLDFDGLNGLVLSIGFGFGL